jgi:hypothetical protein
MSPTDRSMIVDEQDSDGSIVVLPVAHPDRVRLPTELGGTEHRVVDVRAEACVDPRCRQDVHVAAHLVLDGTDMQVCGCKRYNLWLYYAVPT